MRKKLTTEEWIEKAQTIHGNKFDYSKVDYQGNNKKITIICPIHGEFQQVAADHLKSKYGCPKCVIEAKSFTTEQFIEKAKKIYESKYDYSLVEYKGINNKVKIICPIHGIYEQEASVHLKGIGCPKCSGHLGNKKCNTEYFIEKARKVHGDKYDYSKVNYVNATTPIKIICQEHGEFEQRPDKHLAGHNCPKCTKHYKRNTTEFIEEANIIHNNKYNYSKVNFVNVHTKVIIICPIHGDFEQTPHMHLQGKGCPKCTLKNQTKLYEKLQESFPNEEILFEVGNSTIGWINGQRFDIYFPKYNIAVEYNGIQHYVPVEHFGGELKFQNQLEYDELKRQKCKENSCTLFEVKYDYTEKDYQKLVENIQNIINNYVRS